MGSNYKNVFTPITIRGVEFKNRIEMAPTSPKFTTKEGYITQEHIDYFRAVARGGAAIVTMGNCSVDIKNARDEPRHVGLDDNDYISGLSRLSDMCERYGIICSAEVNHAGLDALYDFTGVPAIGPSPMMMEKELQLAAANGREPICGQEMSLGQIKETIQKYINGAYRLKVAGFKMCMVHGGHGNLISQFASPLFNKRTDEYGGKLENRARFAIEILDGIRKKCGDDFVIEFRVSADEKHPDGMHFEETKDFLKLLDDKIDIVNVSCGLHSHFKYFRYWSPNMYMPHMINVPYAAELKKILKCKVTAVAGIANLDEAEKILSEGNADFVAMARPLMADPDMVRKYAFNQPQERRPCIRCGYCGRRMMAERTTACAVNPMLGREHELIDGHVIPAQIKKKVAVIGAGPAGMQATLTLLERGHAVMLFEKEPVLGGNLITASFMDLKSDMREYLEYIRRQVSGSSADIRLGTEATTELIKEFAPDAIIIATGSVPNMPDVPGIGLPHVRWAADVDMGKYEAGESIVIVGGGSLGLESAVMQSRKGRKVTVIEMMSQLPMSGDAAELLNILSKYNTAIVTGRRLSAIKGDRVICNVSETGLSEEYPCDTVLISAGMVPRRGIFQQLRHLLPETEVYVVGDAKEPRAIGDAIREGFDAALNI
jgi:2,4-dienoyl-CoA reductase-like NADH-dependent reductase (Old Yellow Enzyme family)/thioredoxin reductase